MTDELLERIARDPDNELEHLRVYADTLLLAGDPHGELINVAIQRQQASTPVLARREAALVDAQAAALDALLGKTLRPTYTWKRGFLDTIAFEFAGDDTFDVLPKLAAAPIARLLRRIVMATLMIDGNGDVQPILVELAQLAWRFPRLVEIAVRYSGNFGNPWIDGPTDIHDVSALYAAYPNLELLELGGDAAQLGELALPRLHTLIAPYLGVDEVRRLVAAKLPSLAHLEIAIRPQRMDNIAATLGPLLHRSFPRLRFLSLGPRTREAISYVIDELPTCPLARSITQLAFRGIQLEPMHLEALLAHAPALRRLDRIELVERPIAASMAKRLFAAFGRALALV